MQTSAEKHAPSKPGAAPKAQPADYGLDPSHHHTTRELEAVIKRAVKTKNVDLKAFFDSLTPDEIVRMAAFPEFDALMFSMGVRAADGTERLTRGQWKALEYLERRAQAGRRPKGKSEAPTGPLEVGTQGDTPEEASA